MDNYFYLYEGADKYFINVNRLDWIEKDVLAFQLEYNSYIGNLEGVKYLEEIGKYYKIPVDQFIEIIEKIYTRSKLCMRIKTKTKIMKIMNRN